MRNFLSPLRRLRTLLSPRPEVSPDTPVASGSDTPPKCSEQAASAPQSAVTGSKGEQAAAAHVQALGWRILDRNWRHGSWELDIVAIHADTIIFLEVKTRRSDGMSSPLEALTPTKQARLVRAARHWIAAHNAWAKPCRFDLAAVTVCNGIFNTELIHNVIELGDSSTCKGGRTSGGGHTAWQPW